MSKEFGDDIIKRQLKHHAENPRIPMREQIRQADDLLRPLLAKSFEIQGILHERKVERQNEKRKIELAEAKRRMKWIEDSNTVTGVFDVWQDIHHAMNKRPTYSRHFDGRVDDFLDEMVSQEEKAYKKANPKKKSKKRREAYDKYKSIMAKVAWENFVNGEFETARLQDLKDMADGTYFDNFENEDTQE
jgi:hypothetical protein